MPLLEVNEFLVYNDSHLVMNQVNDTFEAKENGMKKIHKRAILVFGKFEIKQIPRGMHTLTP